MSLERVLAVLQGLGLSRTDSEVYIYLAKTGPTTGIGLAAGLGIVKHKLHASLKRLEEKDVVTRSSNCPAFFAASAFEELLDRYMKLNIEQAHIINETRKELLDNMRNRVKREDA